MQSVQTNAQKSEGRGWNGEMRTQALGWVGTWGPGEKSLLGCWGDATRAGSGREGGSGQATRALGQVPGDLLCANAGQAGRGPRPRSPEQSRRARGAWLLTTRSSCRPRRGLRARRSRGLGATAAATAAREEERRERAGESKDEEKKGRAGCSAAATCSASLVPEAGRGGGSGKRTARITQWEGKEREAGKGRSPARGEQPQRPPRCTPRLLLSSPLQPPPANSRESDTRPLRPSACSC